MRFGAYFRKNSQEIVWFRTSHALDAGFYHRDSSREEPPDVYISESVPDLIMKAYPWIEKEQGAFQQQVGSPELSAEEKSRISDHLAEQLVTRLDPDDVTVWDEEPDWVKYLRSG